MKTEDIHEDIDRVKQGYELWERFQVRYGLETDVVLMLTNDNLEYDLEAVHYLKVYMKRNMKENAHVFYLSEKNGRLIGCIAGDPHITIHKIDEEELKLLYDLYSFYKFYDHIFFTYTQYPQDNLLGRIMKETGISAKEAVCLALYNFREVIEAEVDHV